MLSRILLRPRVSTPKLSSSHLNSTLSNRRQLNSRIPLPIIRPTLWCFSIAGTILVGCAAWDVYSQERRKKKNVSIWKVPRQSNGSVTLSGTEKVIAGTIGVNATVFLANRLMPGTGPWFSHLPARQLNYTLLTSMFGHAGFMHLALNMYGLYNFGPQVARSHVFQNNAPHLSAFYLTTGLFSSLAYHLTSKFASPRVIPPVFFTPGLGASGAIFGLVGAWAMLHKDAQLGLIFLPGGIPADQALMGMALFETIGLLVGFKSLPFAHAPHLVGLAIGVGYVQFDGRTKVWEPTRRIVSRGMRRVGII